MTPVETTSWLAAIALALGIVAPVNEVVAGLFVAIAGAFLIWSLTEKQKKASLFISLFSAVFVAIVVAMVHSDVLARFKIQLVMGVFGTFSSYIMIFGREFAAGVASRGGKIGREWNIPFLGGKGDD